MQHRPQILALLEQALTKLDEVRPKSATSAVCLKEGEEVISAVQVKVAEESDDTSNSGL